MMAKWLAKNHQTLEEQIKKKKKFDKFIEVVDTFVNFLIKNVKSKIQNLKVKFR